MSDLTPKENTTLDIAMTRLGELVDRMERASHPYPRARTWPDCEGELEKMTADTLTKDQSLELMQAEIERLRCALEAITIVPVGEGAAGSMRKIAVQALRVRETLGE